MTSPEPSAPPVSLEDFASINAALEVGLPRDEILKEAGLTPEAWQAAQDHWLGALASQAARGEIRASQRYIALQNARQPAIEAKARKRRRALSGQLPVAPEPRITRRLTQAGGANAPSRPPEKRSAPPPFITPAAPPPIMPASPGDLRPAALPSIVSPSPADLHPPAPPARRERIDPGRTMAMRIDPAALSPKVLPFAEVEKDDAEPSAVRASPAGGALPFTAPGGRDTPPTETVALRRAPVAQSALPFRAPEAKDGIKPEAPNRAPPAVQNAASPSSPPKAMDATTTAPMPPLRPLAPAAALPFRPPEETDGNETLQPGRGPVRRSAALPFRPPAGSDMSETLQPGRGPAPQAAALPFRPPADSDMSETLQPGRGPAPEAAALPFRPPADSDMGETLQPGRGPALKAAALPFRPPADSDMGETLQPGRGPALKAAALPFRPPADSDAGETLQPGRGPAIQREDLPFQRQPAASPAGPARLAEDKFQRARATPYDRWSLVNYADLCACVRAFPTHIPWIQAQFGLTPEAWSALHVLWQQRFQESPGLKDRWQHLIAEQVSVWRGG